MKISGMTSCRPARRNIDLHFSLLTIGTETYKIKKMFISVIGKRNEDSYSIQPYYKMVFNIASAGKVCDERMAEKSRDLLLSTQLRSAAEL